MATATLKVLSHDHTVTTIDSTTPLAVQTANETTSPTLNYATGTTAAAGQPELIAAPGAGVQIIVTAFVIQNESATATTMRLEAGAVAHFRVLAQNQGDGLSGTFEVGREWELPANTALNLWLSGANSCGYSIVYYTQ